MFVLSGIFIVASSHIVAIKLLSSACICQLFCAVVCEWNQCVLVVKIHFLRQRIFPANCGPSFCSSWTHSIIKVEGMESLFIVLFLYPPGVCNSKQLGQ